MFVKLAMAVSVLIVSYFPLTPVSEVLQEEAPTYAKWSRAAIQKTQLEYPQASIIDYLYMGSVPKKEMTVATFRLWLREGKREYAVVVRVTYETKTEKQHDIQLQEIQPPHSKSAL